MLRTGTLLSRQIVSIIIVVYCIGFWQSATQLPYGPAVLYPQLVIGVLCAFIAIEFLRDLTAAGRHHLEGIDVPADASPADDVAVAAEDDGAAGIVLTATGPRDALADIWAERQKIFATGALTIAYMLAIPRLGFYPASGIFLAIMFPYLGVRSPVRLLALWAGSLAVSWLLFTFMLSVRLPRGIWM